MKALNSFNLDILEPCANFLGINLSDSEENKLFTKESLINKIILGIRALLPSQCSDCNQQYTVVLDSENPPVFTCHICYQGSHDCDTIKSLHSALGSTSTKLYLDTCGFVVNATVLASQSSYVSLNLGTIAFQEMIPFL